MSKPDLTDYPERMDRRQGAAFVTKHYFPVRARSLEKWPLTWLHVNGKALAAATEYAAVAEAKLAAATPIRGGKRAAELATAA